YAQLASRAYDRALQLDKSNTTAQVKLSMIKDLFSSQKLAAAAAATPAVTPVQTGAQPEPAKAAPPKVAVAQPKPAPAPPKAEPPKTAAVTPAPTKAAPADSGARAQVVSAVEGWARAWSEKDVKGYLGYYAPDFEVPGGASRAAWEKERTERIERPKSIEVDVKILDVKITDDTATATFKQSYKSDTLKSHNTKTLKLVRSGDKWLIRQERAGG
ncbi:MAG TPA: nuclear transport factor 2 family protein, partial [Usitatibacter sp.]|nr:nuclear transport factor 2 family protein [Usitatibacter sp.]